MTEKPRKKFMFKDFQPEERELSPFEELKDECVEILKELEGKKIRLGSNRVSEKDSRVYVVEKVTSFLLNTRGNYSSCMRLENSEVDEDLWPIIKFPSEPITRKRTKEGVMRLILTYSYDTDIQRDFRHLHKNTQPDMKLYIEILD